MEYFYFIAGIIIVVISMFCAYKKRYNTKKWISIITFGVLLSVFFMVLPTKWTKENQTVLMEPLYNEISALLYSFKVIGGRQDINQLNSIGFTGVLRYIYFIINYAAFIAAPILGSTLVLSFVGDTLSKIRYALPSFRKTYVFSQLNDNALLIAKGLRKHNKKPRIVFCNTKESKDSLVESAKKLHGITLYKSCDSVRKKMLTRKYEFCAVSENEDENTELVIRLIKKYNGTKKLYNNKAKLDEKIQSIKKIHPLIGKLINSLDKYKEILTSEINITAFAQSGPNIQLIESLSDDSQSAVGIRFIDTVSLFCNNLIFENPLYNTGENGKNISVMIVGCGTTGLRMLKTAVWSGQVDGYSLKIRIYDKKAKEIEKIFKVQCPELTCDNENITHNDYDIKFIETDICTENFETEIKNNNQLTDATAVYVFTGDDSLNIDISERLFRIFRKGRSFTSTPPVFTWIDDKSKFNLFSADNDYLKKRNIRLIGNVENLFTERAFFGSKLENLALAVHLSYKGMLDTPADSQDYKKAVQTFKNNEYNRRASMATAIHITAKLHSCKILKQDEYELTNEKAAEFNKYIQNNEKELLRLAKNEHQRWNAFMRSEGHSYAEMNIMKMYADKNNSHKDALSKLHPCLTDWDSLEELESYCRDTLKKDNPFRKHDCNIVKDIPKIIMLANKLAQEEQ